MASAEFIAHASKCYLHFSNTEAMKEGATKPMEKSKASYKTELREGGAYTWKNMVSVIYLLQIRQWKKIADRLLTPCPPPGEPPLPVIIQTWSLWYQQAMVPQSRCRVIERAIHCDPCSLLNRRSLDNATFILADIFHSVVVRVRTSFSGWVVGTMREYCIILRMKMSCLRWKRQQCFHE